MFKVELITGLIQPNFKLGIFSLKGKNKYFGEVIPDIKIHAICMCYWFWEPAIVGKKKHTVIIAKKKKKGGISELHSITR